MDSGLRTSQGKVRCCDGGTCLLPQAPWHGTPGGYTNHDCRCAECTGAWSEYHWEGMYQERWREKRAREKNMIAWHRMYYRSGAVPILRYYTEDDDWGAYCIDRIPAASRGHWFEYQVTHKGEQLGVPKWTLKEAKALVERSGRE